MTLVSRFRAQREKELDAIAARYENIGQIYGDLLVRYGASPALAWCRARLADGLPEWLVAMALANAHMTLATERSGFRLSEDVLRRRGPLLLQEPSARSLLESKEAWSVDSELLDAALDAGALTALMRHGAQPRGGRGYPPGTFLRVARAVGLLDLDVEHTHVFPVQRSAI